MLKSFLHLMENKSPTDLTIEFWVDDFGNFKFGRDGETATDYIARNSDDLSDKYRDRIDSRRADKLSREEIIKKMGWCHVCLRGRNGGDNFKEKDKAGVITLKPIKYKIFDKAIISHPFKNSTNQNKEESILHILDKINDNHPNVSEVISIDRNGLVKHYIHNNNKRDRKWTNKINKKTSFLR